MVQESARCYDSKYGKSADGIISPLSGHLARCGISGARLPDAPEHSHVQSSTEQRRLRSDLHPPRSPEKDGQVRIQVKSRYATDCDRSFPVKERTFGAFDFLIAVFLNVGNFFRSRATGEREPEFYTFPTEFIRLHHNNQTQWGKVHLRGRDIEECRNENGFELIATALEIPYPSR